MVGILRGILMKKPRQEQPIQKTLPRRIPEVVEESDRQNSTEPRSRHVSPRFNPNIKRNEVMGEEKFAKPVALGVPNNLKSKFIHKLWEGRVCYFCKIEKPQDGGFIQRMYYTQDYTPDVEAFYQQKHTHLDVYIQEFRKVVKQNAS